MNSVYMLGGEQTDFERNWTKEGKNLLAILSEVLDDGLRAANIEHKQIKELNSNAKVACFVGNFIAEYYCDQGHLGALLTEVSPVYYGVPSARYEAACASGSVAIEAAVSKIRAGELDLAIVAGWELMKTVDAKTGGDYLGRAAYYESEAKGVDFPFPKLFGRLADEILIKYKTEEKTFMDSLAVISEKNYSNAKKNPKAQTRKWFMNLEQASTRGNTTNALVGGKLAISDCSQVTDGAAVVVLASEKFLKQYGKGTDYPVVLGCGHRNAPMVFSEKIKESSNIDYILPWTRQAVVDAYSQAALDVDNIDFFETHDCFTSSEYVAVSAFGLSKPGEEYKSILEGKTQVNGEKPINASGGLIGCGHPVGATGVRMFLDLYKQLAGKAGKYQLKNVKTGAMLNIGGSATTNYVFVMGI